jgi:hypothetical protein
MHGNTKMIPVETVPGISLGEMKQQFGRDTFK